MSLALSQRLDGRSPSLQQITVPLRVRVSDCRISFGTSYYHGVRYPPDHHSDQLSIGSVIIAKDITNIPNGKSFNLYGLYWKLQPGLHGLGSGDRVQTHFIGHNGGERLHDGFEPHRSVMCSVFRHPL